MWARPRIAPFGKAAAGNGLTYAAEHTLHTDTVGLTLYDHKKLQAW